MKQRRKSCRAFEISIVHLQAGVRVTHTIADVQKTVQKAERKRVVLAGA
jgi:hypothetical protein